MQTKDEKTILAFAKQVGEMNETPETTARIRGWIDENGSITEEGGNLLEALQDQRATRTVFRGNF